MNIRWYASWLTLIVCSIAGPVNAEAPRLTKVANFAAPDRDRSAQDWTGWLGPDRNGWVAGFEKPLKWPRVLRKVWAVDVGTGYGTPLVIGNRIYQHARQGDKETVWCIDRATGNTVWRRSFLMPFKTAGGGEYHGNGPKSCPVYAAGRLFSMSIDGTLTAWDAEDGRQLWQRNYDNEFGKSHPNWGASTSPVVDGQQVIAHFGTDEVGTLVALNVETGREVWRYGKDGPSYSSPLVVELAGVRQVIEWNHRALVGVESGTGKFLWQFPFPHIGSDQNMPTPAVHAGRILLGGENRGIYSVHPRRSKNGWKVDTEWHQKQVALDMSSAVIHGAFLYGFSHYDSGRLFCLDPLNGEVRWTGPPRTGQNVTFLAADGIITALINRGELRILKASARHYHQLASFRVADGHTWAPPVLLPDGLLIKDRSRLTKWSFNSEESSQ